MKCDMKTSTEMSSTRHGYSPYRNQPPPPPTMRGLPQRAQSTIVYPKQKEEVDVVNSIPFFFAEQYASSKDKILAATIPNQDEAIHMNPVQESIDRNIDMHRNLVDSIHNLSKVLSNTEEFLPEAPDVSPLALNVDYFEQQLAVSSGYIDILNEKIFAIMEKAM